LDPTNLFPSTGGIDLYIDECRFLPETTTHTRLLVRGLTRDHKKLLPTEKIFPEFGNDASSRNIQVYDYRVEIRP
jgi:hypothetical protein